MGLGLRLGCAFASLAWRGAQRYGTYAVTGVGIAAARRTPFAGDPAALVAAGSPEGVYGWARARVRVRVRNRVRVRVRAGASP